MEIERKWMVTGWPEGLPMTEEFTMRQGYISVRPTVRIREEAKTGGDTAWILCFKSAGGLAREEIERPIDHTYRLPDGCMLEVNHVDAGQPGAFWYAEIEYPTIPAANQWDPAADGLAGYLSEEVTGQPGQSMGAYWERTRG